MDRLAKVAWSEGMLLRPQHFQQQDRFQYQIANKRHRTLYPLAYGVAELTIDTQALALGQFSLISVTGVFPDGMPFEFDQKDHLALVVPEDAKDELVYLTLPLEKQRGANVGSPSNSGNTRFKLEEISVVDESQDDGQEESLGLAYLNPSLKLEREELVGYASIPIARIIEVIDQTRISLDKTYIPPCLDMTTNGPLSSLLREILAMLKQRADALAARMLKSNQQAASLLDILMLQTLNRWQPQLEHYKRSKSLHPELGYQLLTMLTGELATFIHADRRVPELPTYQHNNLTATFGDLAAVLSQSLSTVLEQTAIALKLDDAKFGIKVSALTDKTLLKDCQIVLAIKADVPSEEIRRRLPAQIKISAVEHIRDLVNNHLPGIAVSVLPVAPRQIPYHAGYHYFLLDDQSDRWQQLQQSGGLAIHVSGHYPGINIELWAIRQ